MTRLINYIVRRHKQRQTFNTLWNMSEKDLKDIGITRGDIVRVAYGKETARCPK